MKKLFRVSCLGLVGLTAVACSALACSSSTNTASNAADGGGGGGGDEGGSAADGGAGGDGSTTVDAGTTAPTGTILVTQTHLGSTFHYSISAAFRAFVVPTGSGSAPTQTTMGACTATVIPTPPSSEAGTPMAVAGLNAGTLTITGTGMPASTMLAYGPVASQQGVPGYTAAGGSTELFAAGDTMTVSGAGGADLPAFAGQSLVTPTQVAVTAPACTGTCPDLDRTQDLIVAWTGAGAGKVVVTFETISDTQAVLLQCRFDATAGTGTVPAALLGKLDKAGEPNVSGIEQISDENEVAFPVGTAATKFTIQHTNVQSLLTVSN
ncbi:MAG: hypothetical protein QOI41_5948 [Myxococcales bacterium]|jgi:hypothetical protein|nr:hypothetical protein [Myxococcales bacterium]